MNKTIKFLHRWIAIPLGLLIALICLTGAILSFEKEITSLQQRDLLTVDAGSQRLPIDRLMTLATQHAPEGMEVSGITLSADPTTAAKAAYKGKKGQGLAIDPYTGEVKGEYKRAAFFSTMQSLHRFLLVKTEKREDFNIGRFLVGSATLAMTILLLTGLILWWPRNLKMLRNRLRIEGKKGWWRIFFDLHVSGGFWALLFLLAMSLTGPTWSFKWYGNAFAKAIGAARPDAEKGGHSHGEGPKNDKAKGGEKGKRRSADHATEKGEKHGEKRGEKHEKGAAHDFSQWEKAFAQVQQNYQANYESITVTDGSINVSAPVFGNSRASDKYRFDPSNGKVTEKTLYAEQPNWQKKGGWIYSFHTGSWGGWFGKLLWLVAALLGTTLPLTGYYLWLKRIGKKGKR